MEPATSPDYDLEALEFSELRRHLARLAGMEEAREKLLTVEPSRDIHWIKTELARVEEIRGLLDRGGSLGGWGLRDIRPQIRRAAVKGSALSAEDLLAVLQHLRAHNALRRALDRERDSLPLVIKLAKPLTPLKSLKARLDRVLTPEAGVRDDASPELARLRRRQTEVQEQMRRKLAALVPRLARQGALREESFTVREGRYVLPVRSDALGKVKGIVHDRSASGVTLFVEPAALIDLGNELRAVELAERDEVQRILQELTGLLRREMQQFQANERVLVGVDCLLAKGGFADRLEAHPPAVVATGPLRIFGGRHPLLVLAGGERTVVPLDLELGADFTTLVISGPNAGGKSVALKCVGLLALMAACGLHTPALPGTEIPLFDRVMALIGDRQSISDDLSTFTAHAGGLKTITAAAGSGSLVLIDEIGAGTDPQEGTSLSIAVLEQLTRRGTFTIVTTHHGALKAFAHAESGCANGSMEFDLDSFQPTYRFRPGLPGSSYALEIARRAGLPREIISRAREVLGRERSGLEDLITDLSNKLRHYESLVLDGEKTLARREAEEKALTAKAQRLKERERRLKERAAAEVERLVGESRRRVEALVKDIRERGADRQSIKQAHRELRRLGGEAAEPEPDAPTAEPATPAVAGVEPLVLPGKEPAVGDWVAIDDTNTSGEVTAVGSHGERVCVAVGAVQLWVQRRRVKVIEPPQAVEREARTFQKLPEVPFELDVRGLDPPEALHRVDNYLYDGLATGRRTLGIIHGKGTGALMRHIRSHLKNHDAVQDFRFGEYGEGDYGVTIVTLKDEAAPDGNSGG